MSDTIYEHHLALKQDKFCPFKFNSIQKVRDSVCNWHSNIEILIVTDGNGRMQYNSDDFPVTKQDIIMINSGDLHRIYSEKEISFDYLIIDENFCRENGLCTADRCFDRLFNSEELKGIFDLAYHRYKKYKIDASPVNTALLRLSVLNLITELYCHYSVPLPTNTLLAKTPQAYVKKTIEYLAEHYTEKLTLDELAGICGITKYHLAREFKRYTGQTLITYVNVLRCRKAEHCLSEGMTVTEYKRKA